MRLQPAGRRGEHFDIAGLRPGDILSAWDSAETSGCSAQPLPQGPFSLAPLPQSWAVAPLSGCEGLSCCCPSRCTHCGAQRHAADACLLNEGIESKRVECFNMNWLLPRL